MHEERDILFTDDTPLGIVRKEEAWVEAETTRRLVPLDELEQLVRSAVLDDRCVTWREVSEWFDVPQYVADDAMARLQRRTRGRHPTAR